MLKLDPFELDRTISRFAALRERFLQALAEGGGEDHAFETLPLGFNANLFLSLEPAKAQDPLAPALLRWTRFLLHEHACLEERRRVAQASRFRYRLDEPERIELGLFEMRRRVVSDAARGADWQRALETHASALASRRFEYFERWNEQAEAFSVLAPEWVSGLGELGGALVAATDAAFAELRPRSLGDLARHGLGREAPGDYPKRLTPRALADLLGEGEWLAGLEPKLGALPEVLGAASIARGLDALGRALHDAGASRKQPFVVAFDPLGLRRAEFGSLLALLALNPAFATRRLGVDRARERDYLRVMSRVALVALRAGIARTALALASRVDVTAYRQAFELVVPRATGCELRPSLAGVVLARASAAHDFAALLSAVARAHDLVEKQDLDWFRNPRAVEELRAELESPPELDPNVERLVKGAELLVKAIAAHW